MWPIPLALSTAAPLLMPSAMAPGEPASTCVEQRRRCPVEPDKGEGERSVERVLLRWDQAPTSTTLDGAGRADLDQLAREFGPLVAGSHSIGGTSTPLPLRIPRIFFSVSAVMNAPITWSKRPLVRKRDAALLEPDPRLPPPLTSSIHVSSSHCRSVPPSIASDRRLHCSRSRSVLQIRHSP